jgi:hypothetical protein
MVEVVRGTRGSCAAPGCAESVEVGAGVRLHQSARSQKLRDVGPFRSLQRDLGHAALLFPGQHVHLVGADLGDVAALAVFLVGAVEDHALDVDALALRQVLAADLRRASPRRPRGGSR